MPTAASFTDLSPEDFFRKVAPEMEDLTDTEIQIWLSVATAQLSSEAWGDLYRLGVTYLAAHFASFSAEGGGQTVSVGGGQVTFERAGEVARNYAIPSGGAASDVSDSTKYGKLFKELRKRLKTRLPITTSPNIDWINNTRKVNG